LSYYTKPLKKLIDQLVKLPGIGPKTAQRLAFHLLEKPKEDSRQLAQAILDARDKIRFCQRCFNFSSGSLCDICQDANRQTDKICIVEDAKDIVVIEKTGLYRGLYHVLGGVLSPIDGIGPKQLKVAQLINRIKQENVKEVIVATNPTLEGEQTAMYIAEALKPYQLKVTRIASGMPVGGDLEYADELTVSKALEGRQVI
jgi:recombination protein RecR